MADVRSTQEIFGDLFGGLASLGARGVDGLIISRALANLLVEKGIITIDELVETMRRVIHDEMAREDNSTFLLETYQEIIRRLEEDKNRPKEVNPKADSN
ncbi:MAG: hypothetical protein KJ064_10490 [Anaerolineae bacterium]|jgi:hypothetical protein|nr:MAG: hypothetical protein F9K27_11765 [Anaerolineae bacterium]MCL4877079.1 hypothetical protein [Anaerolineae bacterium]